MKTVNYSILANTNAQLFVLQQKMLKEGNLAFFKDLEWVVKKYQESERLLDFDGFRKFIQEIDDEIWSEQEKINPRLGIFDVMIADKKGNTILKSLKEVNSLNKDLFGFSLNHYHNYFPYQKKTKYFDGEDACVDIHRKDFLIAIVFEKVMIITLRSKTIHVCW